MTLRKMFSYVTCIERVDVKELAEKVRKQKVTNLRILVDVEDDSVEKLLSENSILFSKNGEYSAYDIVITDKKETLSAVMHRWYIKVPRPPIVVLTNNKTCVVFEFTRPADVYVDVSVLILGVNELPNYVKLISYLFEKYPHYFKV